MKQKGGEKMEDKQLSEAIKSFELEESINVTHVEGIGTVIEEGKFNMERLVRNLLVCKYITED